MAQSSSALSYRLSCVRSEKKNHKYKRQELMTAAADIVVPPNTSLTKGWKVELNTYDLEFVLVMKSNCLAIGINLRPYNFLGAKDFSSGSLWPPDITPPYLSGSTLSGIIRLRPTTAQMMLHLAQLQPGDILLDPCAGIGTIPVEAQFLSINDIALGGDLVLTPEGFGPVGCDYVKGSRKIQKSSSSLDLFLFDASQLPFRTGIVDAIVSDLPFGQTCLSAAKLDQLMPLIMLELARVLRPSTGRCVLLCGCFGLVLEALKNANQNTQHIWQLPCTAVSPVNIGGIIAWIVQVKRGPGIPNMSDSYKARVRRLLQKRELVARIQGVENNKPKKKKRLQS
ncbi:hypothetical protein ACA910_011007 [Epithemia clementina (nom. ined.)]